MHPRTLLALVTFPLVASFTYPVVVKDGGRARQAESSKSAQDPLAGLSDIQDVLSLVKDNYVDQPDMAKVVQGVSSRFWSGLILPTPTLRRMSSASRIPDRLRWDWLS